MDIDSAQLESSVIRLFDVTPVPTLVTTPSGAIVYSNPAVRQLLGYTHEELTSKDVVITHPDDVKHNGNIRSRLVDENTHSLQLHKRYIHKDGHTVFAQLNIAAQLDSKGSVTHFVSQIIDQSGMRQSQAAELLLYQLVCKSHDAIYVVDIEYGQILNCNELAYKRLGYSKQELLKMTVPDINPLFGSEMSWKEHVAKMEVSSHRFVEATHRRKDGSELPIEANISRVEFNGEFYFLAVVRDISERKAREIKNLEAQNLDPLTDMPNRRLLDQKLHPLIVDCQQNNQSLAFLYLDVDNFKSVNDSYGHGTGDKVLVELADRIKDFTRQSDLVARLGGDEFVIIMAGLKNRRHAESIAKHLLQVFSHPFEITDTLSLNIDLSIGIALFDSGHICAVEALSIADKAMYLAKKRHGSTIEFLSGN